MPIRAITFDFWRTLFRNTRREERHRVRVEAIAAATGLPIEQADAAMADAMNKFMHTHIHEQRTLGPRDAIRMLEESLRHKFDVTHADHLDEIFATTILQIPPEPIEGALEAVRAAAERGPVGLISDSGISPGASLYKLLERHGFAEYFQVCVFSDEIGVAKPQAAMFHAAATGIRSDLDCILHIGDLEPTDILGAMNCGATAALFAGDNTRFLGNTKARHTFTEWTTFCERLPKLC